MDQSVSRHLNGSKQKGLTIMNYKNRVDPELKHIAKKVPYNRLVIKCANIFQAVSLHFTAIPEEITHSAITLAGYRHLPFKVDIFEPSQAGRKLPCLIYVHGGAFSYRASAYHKKLACMYAAKANCRVYFPDYHLMPRYPYPAAYQDVLALYRYISDHPDPYGIDPERIGVAGDSAGASIAALICNNYEQESLTRPCLQMLVYPLTDATMQTDSMQQFSDTPLWNSKNNKRMWRYYRKNLSIAEIDRVSPMHSHLPPSIPDTYIETAEYDCLRDEGLLYGKKLQEAGANVEMNETSGTIHGYDSALTSKIAIQNTEKRILFLKKGFHSHVSEKRPSSV